MKSFFQSDLTVLWRCAVLAIVVDDDFAINGQFGTIVADQTESVIIVFRYLKIALCHN